MKMQAQAAYNARIDISLALGFSFVEADSCFSYPLQRGCADKAGQRRFPGAARITR